MYAILLASFSTGLYYIGISLGYLYLLMGVIISSAVLPAALTLLWSQQNWAAATFSPCLGFICAMVGWLVQAKKEFGILSVDSTGSNYPMLVGNVVALLAPCVFIPILTFAFKPQNYDWESMRLIKKADDHDLAAAAHIDLEMIPGGHEESRAEEEAEQAQLLRASKIARWLTVFLTLALLVFWPMPMLGSEYVFSKPFFRGWVVVAIMWLFFSGFTGEFDLFVSKSVRTENFTQSWYIHYGREDTPCREPSRPLSATLQASGSRAPWSHMVSRRLGAAHRPNGWTKRAKLRLNLLSEGPRFRFVSVLLENLLAGSGKTNSE